MYFPPGLSTAYFSQFCWVIAHLTSKHRRLFQCEEQKYAVYCALRLWSRPTPQQFYLFRSILNAPTDGPHAFFTPWSLPSARSQGLVKLPDPVGRQSPFPSPLFSHTKTYVVGPSAPSTLRTGPHSERPFFFEPSFYEKACSSTV